VSDCRKASNLDIFGESDFCRVRQAWSAAAMLQAVDF